jgi:hypothetical protein
VPQRRKTKASAIEAAFLEFQRHTKKRKRHTPARVLGRRLVSKKTRGATLAVLAAAGVAVLVFANGYVLAVLAGLVAFLILCEAWPEIARWAYVNRRMLTPFTCLALMVFPEILVAHSRRAAMFAGLLGFFFVLYAHCNLRIRRADFSHARGYIPRAYLPMAWIAATWTVLVAARGLTRTTLGVLLVAWLVWAVRYWFANRTRTTHVLPLAKVWAATIANPDPEYKDIPTSDRLVGSKLVNIRAVPGGQAATVVLPAGQRGSKVDGLVEVIASAAGVDVTAVSVDQPTGAASANRRELYVLPKAQTNKAIKWKGSDLDLDRWTSTAGTYIDGDRVEYVWREWHDLISGTTGSGKSRCLDLLLATSRAAGGLIVDWVIDPQNGQSLPDWQDEVDWFAAGVDDGKKLLKAARSVMYSRNQRLSRQEWVDERGKTRRGVKSFTATPDMPLLVVTIEEAHAVLNDKESLAIVEDMSKMARKCGIKVRLVTQVPTLSQLGGSNVLRSMVASGNVIVLRTGNRSDGEFAFQGALKVDPVSIPRRMPDGSSSAGLGFSLGAESRQAPMRLDYVEDPFDYISGPVWRLSDADAKAAGRDYANRNWEDAGDDIVDVEVISETHGDAQEAPESVVLRGPGGITCADRVIQIVRGAGGARVSRSTIAEQLHGTWKLQNITKTIKELCENPASPVWSDDQRTTLYYQQKEAS